jgi:hypothetical protein
VERIIFFKAVDDGDKTHHGKKFFFDEFAQLNTFASNWIDNKQGFVIHGKFPCERLV